MSKWLKAARSARASKLDSGPFYAHANSANSANSPPYTPLERPNGTNDAIGTGGESLIQAAHVAIAPDLRDPEDVRAWLIERAAKREDSSTPRADADRAAFDELLWLWCAANPKEPAPGRCAACGTTFEPPVMALPDGAQVCDKLDHACLITYGNGRRQEAVRALRAFRIEAPAWWEL